MTTAKQILQQIIERSRAAENGDYGVLSSGEKLAAALVLNRADWLADAGYTLADAIDRLNPAWLAQIPAAAQQLAAEREAVAAGLAKASQQAHVDALLSPSHPDEAVGLRSTLSTYGNAPGYRDATLYFTVEPLEAGIQHPPTKIELRIRPEDAEVIVRHLTDVHRSAWKAGRRPLDATPDEQRPRWIGAT